MSSAIDKLFSDLELHPVLMDVGATGEIPALWTELAPHSTYVGVGPSSESGNYFRQTHSIEKIVTPDHAEIVFLHLMRNPIYSSLLEAHPQAITDFLDPHLQPAGEIPLASTTVDEIATDLALPGIDWLHTNINGVDVPIFQSLSRHLKPTVLALDSCLDVVDLYQNQQSGVARYPELLHEGFWLSRTFVDGPIKMRQASLAKLQSLDPSLNRQFIIDHHRRTPGWIFVRFLRTLEFLARRDSPRRDYALLWTFALLDNQFGFCTDLLLDYEHRFGSDKPLRTMQAETVARLRKLRPLTTLRRSGRSLPALVRRGLRWVVDPGSRR